MSGQSVMVAIRATTGRLSLSTTGRAVMLLKVREGIGMGGLATWLFCHSTGRRTGCSQQISGLPSATRYCNAKRAAQLTRPPIKDHHTYLTMTPTDTERIS